MRNRLVIEGNDNGYDVFLDGKNISQFASRINVELEVEGNNLRPHCEITAEYKFSLSSNKPEGDFGE